MNLLKLALFIVIFFQSVILCAQLELSFSQERGYYENSFQLEIQCNDPLAIIKYTLDYKEPSPSLGTTYSSPITIDGTLVIRAIAYTNSDTSQIFTQSYFNIAEIKSHLPLDGYSESLTDSSFTSIPTVSIVNSEGTVYDNDVELKASIEWLPFFNQTGTLAHCGIKHFGGSFTNFAKKSFRVYFREDYGTDKLKYPVFGDTKENVATEFNQIEFRSSSHDMYHRGFYMSSSFVDKTFAEMGNQSTHGIHVNLFLNGQYWGQYYMRERFGADYFASYFGGKDDDYECLNGNYNLGANWHPGTAYDGDGSLWTSAKSQLTYAAIKESVNLNNLIDYMLLYFYGNCENEYRCGASYNGTSKFIFQINDSDGFLRSAYGGDFGANTTTGPGNVFGNLRADNHEDFNILLADRIYNHFVHPKGSLRGDVSIDRLTKLCKNVESSMITECARWNYRTYSSWESLRDTTFYFLQSKETEVFNALKARGDYTLLNAVVYNVYGGLLNQGEVLNLTNPNETGSIYYTMDGSDPRLPQGGLNPNAILYQNSISLTNNVNQLFARVFDVSQEDVRDRWSAGASEIFYLPIDYSNLIINEIHYAAKDSIHLHQNTNVLDTISGKHFEFVEIKNIGSDTIYLTNSSFTKGVNLEIKNLIAINPNEFAVFAEDGDWFEWHYGFAPDGVYTGKLDNDGEKITLSDPFGNIIDSVRYYNSNPWDEAPDGSGFTLELLHTSLNNNAPLNWFRSDNIHGTPKAENSRVCSQAGTAIIINEINYDSNNDVFDPGDWVELYNPNLSAVDLSGWTFYDNGNAFILPQGTSILPNGYLVLVEDLTLFSTSFPTVNNNVLIGNIGFSLSNKGERISLFDENKCLSDYVIYNDKAPWPIAPSGGGSTLALIDPTLDNELAAYWKTSDYLSGEFIYGSPGKSNLCAAISNTIVCSQINSSADDAEERLADGSVSISSLDLDMVNDAGELFTVGIRFQNINVPQGATITSAVLAFSADEINTLDASLIFKGENIDNAPAFAATINNITNRTTTLNTATWQPDSWTSVGENGVNQKTVDLSSIIQEIVERPGFSTGNAIALIIEGTGIRTAESFDGSPELAPKLCLTYSLGNCGIQAKVLLEGYYDAVTQEMHTKLQDKGLLPTLQPFNTTPWNYSGTESAITLPSTAVDWVLLMSRNVDGTIINKAAGFIDKAGNLLSVSGNEGIPLAGAENQYFSIHTRSHLAILSANLYKGGVYDFTTASSQAYGIEQQKLVSGKYVLYAGDYDNSGIINNTDFNKWKIQSAQLNEYLSIDGDGNGIINASDYNLWIINRSKIGEQVIRY